MDVVGHFDDTVCQEDDEASAGAECGGVHRQEPRTSRDKEQLSTSSLATPEAFSGGSRVSRNGLCVR